MSLPHDLLTQASELAALDAAQPVQANLRRSISAAYYALFHLLIAESVDMLSPKRPVGLGSRIGRAYSHGDMKLACRSVSEARPSALLDALLPAGFSPQLRAVARTFVYLQDNRQTTDYDTAVSYSRAECEALIDRAHDAFSAWEKVRGSDEAAVFLSALLLHKQWSR